jgi:hypothetical protein
MYKSFPSFFKPYLLLPAEAFNFGIDEFLKVSALLAECYMKNRRYDLAADKYQSVIRKIQAEVVFDKPILLINTCN